MTVMHWLFEHRLQILPAVGAFKLVFLYLFIRRSVKQAEKGLDWIR